MKRITKLMLVTCLAAFFLSACAPKEQKIYVVSTNDMHANIDYFPQMAALIDSLRSVHPDLLLFSAGDNRSGNPINDRYNEPCKPMYELMNEVGFDLSCFGNHEWDGGPVALRNVLTWAKFPFVCANVTFDDTLQMPNVYPYVTFERDGLKVGVIGGIQLGEIGIPDFHPKNAGGSHFVPLHEVLPQYIEKLSDCNAIFLLSHCGFEEDLETAAAFPQLTAIFGGHSHTRVAEKQLVGNVMVTQAEAKVKYVTLSTFTLRNGKVVDTDMQLLSIRDFKGRNEKIQAMIDEYNSNEYFRTIVSQNATPIASYESLGCLMTDAVCHTMGADMAFQNPGGVRFDTLSVRPVTIKDVFALDPFDNEIIQYSLTGQEIINMIKECFNSDHGPVYCSGCSYTYKVNEENDEMTDIEVTLKDGKPLDLNAKYNVMMNSYMSSTFNYEHEDEGQNTFRSSNELLLEYLNQCPEIDYGKAQRVSMKE